jgi:hypothetical protein
VCSPRRAGRLGPSAPASSASAERPALGVPRAGQAGELCVHGQRGQHGGQPLPLPLAHPRHPQLDRVDRSGRAAATASGIDAQSIPRGPLPGPPSPPTRAAARPHEGAPRSGRPARAGCARGLSTCPHSHRTGPLCAASSKHRQACGQPARRPSTGYTRPPRRTGLTAVMPSHPPALSAVFHLCSASQRPGR